MKHYSPMFGHPPLAKEANQFPLVKSKEKPRLLQQSTNMMLDHQRKSTAVAKPVIGKDVEYLRILGQTTALL
ncbi:hypothetical protein OUZ56_020354 [Daphnia magna]|uniref:Uncharacterized protein n=1 Tax=Daphnia magna TaxID=35525 RepID=A0ABQ9ZE96_9CRUS|nr:hypothetical protein OUZ56_020354 [Daphnia magna]